MPSCTQPPPLPADATHPSPHPKVALRRVHSPVRASYFEFVGKNAAIRRACGDWVLTLNADTWLSPSFWEVVGHRNLSSRFYYQAGRIASTLELPPESLGW